jgi:hypothetical protein
MKKNIKNLIKLILMIMLAVFMTALGTIDIDQPDPDTQQNQRIPSVVPLGFLTSVRKSKKSRKGNAKPTVTPEDFKTKMQKGTKNQHKSWKKFSIKRPFWAAKDMVANMCSLHKLGRGTIDELFNREVLKIAQSAEMMKDPAYRVDYTLHCINNLGSAISAAKKAYKGDFPELTITPKMVERAMRSAFADEEPQYKLSVDDHMVTSGKNAFPGTTNTLNRMLIRASHSALRLFAKQTVLETADKDYNQFVANNTDEAALKTAAKGKIKEMQDYYYEFCKLQVEDADFLPQIMTMCKLQGAAKAEPTDALIAAIEAEEADLAKILVNNSRVIQSKSEFVLDRIKAKTTELTKACPPSRVITMRRGNDITCQWHLTHMSEWKKKTKKGKVFAVKNTHSGARFLLGPSNGIRVPNNVIGDSLKEGSRQFTGDAVSMQMILCSHIKGPMTPKTAQANSEMHFMMQLALDPNPDKSSRVVGLYTHPDVVADPNHDAPALAKLVANGPPMAAKPKKTSRKRLGPNTQKNSKVRKVNENTSKEPKISKEELAKYAPTQEIAIDNGLTEQLKEALSGEPNDPYGTMTKGELQQVCRNQKIPGFSSLAKLPLLQLVRGVLSPVTPNPVKPKAPKAPKAPPASRKQNN